MSENLLSQASLKAIRGDFLDFVDDPFYASEPESVRYTPDGLLVVENGQVKAFGAYESLRETYSTVETVSYPGKIILPGLIDLHVHYSQSEMIGAYGAQLLDWLNSYTFPTEAKFKDGDYARTIASFFLDELLRNGTTTALVLTTIFPKSVDVFFEESQRRNMRMIAGQVLMSRNAPGF